MLVKFEYLGLEMNRAENILLFRRVNMHGTKSGPKADPDYETKYHPGGGNGQVKANGDSAIEGGSVRINAPPVRDDGTVRLHHYSWHPNLTEIDPSYHGEGIPGQESVRKNHYPELWIDRTYYGIAPGKDGGYEKEHGLGMHEYTVDIQADRLYDLENDPLNLMEVAENYVIDRGYQAWGSAFINGYEQVIADHGFSGYWINTGHMGLVAVSYEKHSPKRVEGPYSLPADLLEAIYPQNR
jgi:hypothetical protein